MRVRKKRISIWPFVLFISIVVIFVMTIFFSFGNFFRYRKLLNDYNALKSYMSSKLQNYETKLKDLDSKLGPNSLIDKYILSVNYLKNFGADLEQVLSNIEDEPGTGYFMVFVVGQESSWFTVKKGEKTYFSRELYPGLSKYRFYYFKEPRIKTDYDIVISPDADIVVGKAGKVYLLFYGVGVSFHPTKVVHVTKMTVDNLKKTYNLYVPGR
ncbi:hypothetical protein SU69_03240 [Thermosipho melanesiensis]|uniref:Uncharacterized protein n=2 Tax=Thermosipho melanesiensis TaxID=46541 RepID=A6LKP7_THEM4|nr:hypothetical protein [Thermosipho melanesiensis]ABR30498.1 hypothetical protein Tmel_0634 [Thermosipho melanesiensis BI429]APT73649.1 hypothetical protein BW47_03420 [Thermosipho melanesiensis]OOC35591.1 hypothetical protein SU68_03295 [Thermosipho melanesiensis]OOC39265.1 hypothetical protein SU69_03240 [Thermosipho melanesiensis]OOC39351.1 hypothetical protein SU70_03240 [Thermosipho melanesiensis]